MASRSTTGEQRADARRNRDRILDAATTVLVRNPGATLTDLAEAAGVSRATAYRHFADVAAVHAALLEEAAQVGRGLLSEELGPLLDESIDHGPVLDQVTRIVGIALPLRYRWTAVIASEPIQDAALAGVFAPIARAILKRGVHKGELRDDLDLDVVVEAMSILTIYAVRRFHRDELPLDKAMQIVRPFLDGLRKSAQPAASSVEADER